jgi:hypothetical protein
MEITFLEFCNQLRGFTIHNNQSANIPKFLLYWNGLSVKEVKRKYKLIERE